MNERVRSESMEQVLAVFWEKGVLLNETGAAKERARAHTRQRRGVRVARTERGECEEERTRCRFLEVNAMRGTAEQEGRHTGAGTASRSEGRSGGGSGLAAAAPWRRARPAGPRPPRPSGLRPGAGPGAGSCRQEAGRTALLHRKAVRSHGIPLCRRLSFGAPDASPAHLAPSSLSGDPLSFLYPSC